MTLAEIRHIAETHPEQIQICWDKIDEDPTYKEEFESVVTGALSTLSTMETIYTKLTANQHAFVDGMDTSLNRDEIERYLEALEEELFAGYQMQLMWDAYQKVNEITGA